MPPTPTVGEPPSTPGPAAPETLALLASGGFHDASALARRLELSLAAVHQQVAALREAGLEIEAERGGYRLRRAVDWLDPAAIRARLAEPVRRRVGTIENHWYLDSTSSECGRRAGELPDRSFVFADWQGVGRGRRGRQWLSPPTVNLQVSCLKRFVEVGAALSGLSLAVGVAAAQAVEDCVVADVQLKWPNDLEYRGAKLGGILVELGGAAAGPSHAIIGIGINVYVADAVRAALDRPCTGLSALGAGPPVSRDTLAVALITRLVVALDAFATVGFTGFAAAWAARDALAGRPVRVADPRGDFDGIAAGVDARGALQVRTVAGVRTVDSAQVSVRAA